MCGITGFFNQSLSKDSSYAIIKQMTDALNYRGPDDAGYWLSERGHLALGHRRLAIQDLSQAGHQPMHSQNNRYTIVYNGEVYNFEELSQRLLQKGYRFNGHSDTEVILAAIQEWGLPQALQTFNGMFAFSLYDKETETLFLARDRVGIKPLYYGWQGKTFLFASEIKSLLYHPDFSKTLDRDALTLFMRYQCIPQPFSIYQHIKKLCSGTFLELSLEKNTSTVHTYWDPKTIVQKPKASFEDEATLLTQLDGALKKSIHYQMKADVQYGAFLSGGVDSSLIAALMQAQSQTPIKTFTIGFTEQKYNEAPYAKAIAQHLKTEHHELYVNEADALAVIPRLPTIYDEPFADSSQIPTYLVSHFAKEHVTVCLSGDGGDELFAGYHRHFILNNLWKKIGNYPRWLKHTLATGLHLLSPDKLDTYLKRFPFLVPSPFRATDYANKLYKLQACLRADSITHAYTDLVIQWRQAENLVIDGHIPNHDTIDKTRYSHLDTAIEELMFLDFTTYLQNDLLCKVDRASMACSLEARVPFLDHHFVELAWSIPLDYKIRGNKGKYILRQLLSRYLPPDLFERPKMGFTIPLEHWLRNDLREWAEDLLNPSQLKQQGFFNPALITPVWKAHLSAKQNNHDLLWPVLMFQAWHQHYLK